MSFVLLLGLFACGSSESPSQTVAGAESAPTETTPVTVEMLPNAQREAAPRSWASDVERYEHLLQVNTKKLPADGDAPYALGVQRAGYLFTLNRLTGDEAHLDAAMAQVETAWKQNDNSVMVRRARAQALQKSHRFAEALSMIEKLQTPSDRAMKATLRFELGEYDAAVKELETLIAAEPLPNAAMLGRLAVCQWKLGRFDDAEASIVAAQGAYHGADHWVRGWHHLLLGLMDLERERYDDALAHYQAADAAYPGWWLVEEHIAEIHLEQGRPEAALAIYERVVEQTGSPELMGAMADTLDALGRAEEGTQWRNRAASTFETQLAKNPDAFGGHALEFMLAHGDPGVALDIANHNVGLRPNGDAKLLLADALDANGRAGEADALRTEVRASGWFVPAG